MNTDIAFVAEDHLVALLGVGLKIKIFGSLAYTEV